MRHRHTNLNPEITKAVRQGRRALERDIPYVYAPDDDFVKVIKAGQLIREARHRPVGPLATERLKQPRRETTLGGIFRSIVNQSINPELDTSTGFRDRQRRSSESGCQKAEVFFEQLIDTTLRGELAQHYGGRVVYRDAEPLLLQKCVGAQTLLSLQPLTIEGITYPAGSIMGAHVSLDKNQATGRYEPPHPYGRLEAIDAETVDGLSFLRPSLFALTPAERQEYLEYPSWAYSRKYHRSTVEAVAILSLTEAAEIVAGAAVPPTPSIAHES